MTLSATLCQQRYVQEGTGLLCIVCLLPLQCPLFPGNGRDSLKLGETSRKLKALMLLILGWSHRIRGTKLLSSLAILKPPTPKPKFGLLLLRQFLLCVYKFLVSGRGNGMWGFHSSREWEQGGFFFLCFVFVLLTKETEKFGIMFK